MNFIYSTFNLLTEKAENDLKLGSYRVGTEDRTNESTTTTSLRISAFFQLTKALFSASSRSKRTVSLSRNVQIADNERRVTRSTVIREDEDKKRKRKSDSSSANKDTDTGTLPSDSADKTGRVPLAQSSQVATKPDKAAETLTRNDSHSKQSELSAKLKKPSDTAEKDGNPVPAPSTVTGDKDGNPVPTPRDRRAHV